MPGGGSYVNPRARGSQRAGERPPMSWGMGRATFWADHRDRGLAPQPRPYEPTETANNSSKREKRAAFGLTSFHNYRFRFPSNPKLLTLR